MDRSSSRRFPAASGPPYSVAESERVLHDEALKFEAGRSVINFVLDAASALLTNQSLLSQAERSVSIAELAVDLSLGPTR